MDLELGDVRPHKVRRKGQDEPVLIMGGAIFDSKLIVFARCLNGYALAFPHTQLA